MHTHDAGDNHDKATEGAAFGQQCQVGTELDVMEAMTRRSLVFDVVGLINSEVFQKWIQHLFQIMRQPAPPGFKQPNITQLMRADRQAFVRMQELTRDGIKPPPHKSAPSMQWLSSRATITRSCTTCYPRRQLHLSPKQRPSQSPRRNGLRGNAAAKPLTAPATRCGRRARTKSRAASPPEENFHWL